MNHTENSSFREKLIEHLFIGELLKLSWKSSNCTLEVASPEVDNAGYDVIAEDNGIVRHIQLKASYIGGKTATHFSFLGHSPESDFKVLMGSRSQSIPREIKMGSRLKDQILESFRKVNLGNLTVSTRSTRPCSVRLCNKAMHATRA